MQKYFIHILSIAVVCIFTMLGTTVQGQISGNFPVSITPVIYPPYPSSIKYLNASTSPSLVLTITNKSVNAQNINVNLAVVIKGNNFIATSRSVVSGLAPITLMGGSPVRLTNLDIAPLFDFNNLSGITLSQYQNPFPQSKVVFGFVLYDATTGRQVSDIVNYSVTYSVNYPPTTTLPENKATVIEKGIQNVLFQWQPRQSAPTNGVQYTIQLIELLNNTQDPSSAFLTTKPFFTDSTFSNRYIYGADNPPLLTGKVYAWRVQAKAYDNGGTLISNFQNNGYSNFASFNYFASCKSPSELSADNITKSTADISWAEMPDYSNFTVSYRKKGDQVWTDVSVKSANEPTKSLSGLQPLTSYQVKVKTLCDDGTNAESIIKDFKTSDQDAAAAVLKKVNANCGTRPPKKDKQKDLIDALKEQDIITAGDYSIIISEISGQSGVFSGKGTIEVWLGKPFKMTVSFTNIKVNKDREVIEGKINPSNN
ncbi:fibronectin type III domain-containing protein [Parasediminibacterium paludis]|uniref:Fibronectin type III domain-containing protein n=1 Tax=Parasediminibacterium paludis TaxID=908966 RepID=A0ABV8Q2T3_9BACT